MSVGHGCLVWSRQKEEHTQSGEGPEVCSGEESGAAETRQWEARPENNTDDVASHSEVRCIHLECSPNAFHVHRASWVQIQAFSDTE